jgi:pyrroline-5-carboxylate reductase
MAVLKVAIVGASPIGALLASHLPADRKVIIGPNKEAAVHLADEVGVVASDQASAVRGAQMVFLTGHVLGPFLQELIPHLDEGALLVNMVPDVMTEQLMKTYPDTRFVAAKVIGDPDEMALQPHLVVAMDYVTTAEAAELTPLLAGLGSVRQLSEERVQAANQVVVESMVEAKAALGARLASMGLDDATLQATILTGPSILRRMLSAQSPVTSP